MKGSELASLEVGTVVKVNYDANRGNGWESFEAEVTSVDATECSLDGEFGWVDVTMCRTCENSGDELADDDFPRRRLRMIPGDDEPTVQARHTTIRGEQWNRISNNSVLNTNVEVEW